MQMSNNGLLHLDGVGWTQSQMKVASNKFSKLAVKWTAAQTPAQRRGWITIEINLWTGAGFHSFMLWPSIPNMGNHTANYWYAHICKFHGLHTTFTFQQNMSYHVHNACWWPDFWRWRWWQWSYRQEGCQASNQSSRLHFNLCMTLCLCLKKHFRQEVRTSAAVFQLRNLLFLTRHWDNVLLCLC